MIRSTIINFAIFSLFAFNFVSCGDEQLNVNTQFVQNFTEYIRSNPNVIILQEFERNPFAKGLLRYTIGSRVAGKPK